MMNSFDASRAFGDIVCVWCFVYRPKGGVDYSSLTISLRNKANGLLKESTKCGPNGHFVIPVYESGEFTLSISNTKGWHFGMFYVLVSLMVDELQ